MAQLVQHLPRTQNIAGSSPARGSSSGKRELSSGVVACICLVSITDYTCTVHVCTCTVHVCTCTVHRQSSMHCILILHVHVHLIALASKLTLYACTVHVQYMYSTCMCTFLPWI